MVLPFLRRVVYIALEYRLSDLFSGNGVVARSHVRGLVAQGVTVLVVCGRPRGSEATEPAIPLVKVLSVPLDVWYTTDRNTLHTQFACDAAVLLEEEGAFDSSDAILAVDWTGMAVVNEYANKGRFFEKPVIYLNFRVYCLMPAISEEDRKFYRMKESQAVRTAISSGGGVVALCDADDYTLRGMEDMGSELVGWDSRFRVVLPMLREEFLKIAHEDEDQILDCARKRVYLVSLVRLSEDKGPHRFLKLLQILQEDDPEIWKRTGVVPLVCGADSQPEYARRVKEELKKTVPHAVIMDKFLAPHELAAILKDSVLNIHPAIYEAYGMTIVEAAAMGCPTVLHESRIGAAQLLDPRKKASATVDVTDERALADKVRRLLEDDTARLQLSHSAYLHGTSWTETEHVSAIIEFTRERIMLSSMEAKR